jgi:hypothetical protein
MEGADDYVIFNPHHEYGLSLIERIHERHRRRAVCCFTDPSGRARRAAHELARTHAGLIVGIYHAHPQRLEPLLQHLKARHRVSAVAPFDEDGLLPAAQAVEALGLASTDAPLLRRFRDKYALKAHLRVGRPWLRMNASERVEDVAQVLALRAEPDYRRFVLKPNDGCGNRDIGVFGRDSAPKAIERYFERLRGRAVVMEEYVGGREFFVNGQIDADGRVLVVAVFEYDRQPANGRHNIDFETVKVAHRDPRFQRLAKYAIEVMRASGLRRSPFHLELKVDERGPCLIEVAARLAGHGNARLCGELHGSWIDLLDWAGHCWVSESPYGRAGLDWSRYDADALRYVHGVAEREERLVDIEGLEEVEALPEFYRWVKKPLPGGRVERTTCSHTTPWILIVRAPSEPEAARAANAARNLIRWNRRSAGVGRPLRVLRLRAPRALATVRHDADVVGLKLARVGRTLNQAVAGRWAALRDSPPWARAAAHQMNADAVMASGTILTASPREDRSESLPISHGEGTSPSA